VSWLDDEMGRQKRAAAAALSKRIEATMDLVKSPTVAPPEAFPARESPNAPRAFGFAAHPVGRVRGTASILGATHAPAQSAAEAAAQSVRALGIPEARGIPAAWMAVSPSTPSPYDLQALSDQMELRALREARSLNINEQGVPV